MSKIDWLKSTEPGSRLFVGKADGQHYLAVGDDECEDCQKKHDAHVASIATANGYVKAEDYEVLKKQIDDQVIDCIADAHARVEQLREEDFDALAGMRGYVRLEPGQVVVDATEVEEALKVLCAPCKADCFKCQFARLNSRVKEARDGK